MPIRKLAAAATVVGLLAVVGPVAGAAADSTPGVSQSHVPHGTTLTFVPPSVGPICVTIGPIIIGGKQISLGVHVCVAGASLPTLSWSPST